MKLATKLLLTLAGTVVAGAATLAYVAETRTAKLLEQQLLGRLEDNATHMLEKLDNYLLERLLETRSIVVDPAFLAATAAPDTAGAYLKELVRWRRRYVSAAYFTPNWVPVADTAGQGAGASGDLEGCRADLATGVDFAICVGQAPSGEEPIINLAVAARDSAGAERGVVVMRLPLSVLESRLREVPGFRGANKNLHIDLLDAKGVFLYSNHEETGILRDVSPDWAYVEKLVRAGRPSGSLRYTNPAEKTGEEFLVYVREKGFREFGGSAWTLVLFVPTDAVFAPIRELRLGIAVVVLLTGAGLLAAVILLVRSFTRPIEELGRTARQIGAGNLGVRPPVGSRDELGLFAETFNQMAGALQASQCEIEASKRGLEGQVEERTAELLHTNELLHAELSERFKAQEALAQRERLLRLSADIGGALTLDMKLGTTLQMCCDYIVRDLDAYLVRIWTPGAHKDILELKASAGKYTRLDGQHSRKIVGELKIGMIAKSQRAIMTNEVVGDPAITDQEWARREGIVAFAGNPLVVESKTVGVIALFSRRKLEPFVLSGLEAVSDKIAAFVGRKQAEEALRASEKRFRELFESTIDGVYSVNAEGLFTSMNLAGALIFGHSSPEQIIGRPAPEYWRDPRGREEFLRALKENKSLSAYPMAAQTCNGDPLELEASVRIIEDENGNFLGIQGVLRDASARVRAEAERDLLLAQLQEAAANIRNLSGLLPICAGCKKIRDDQGTWSQIEAYISSHSDASFSHGLCPECQKVYFPGLSGKSPQG